MVNQRKSGSCSICKRRGYTEWHHIISQHHAIRTGQEDLLDNPDNLIELCKRCHDQTTASMVRKRLLKEGKRIVKQPARKKVVKQVKDTGNKTQTKNETRDQRRKRQRAEQMQELERIEESITNLELRGVFWRDSPYNQLKQLIGFLQKVSSEDEVAEKWSEFFHQGARLRALYPKDHWLYDEQHFDKTLSSDFEKEGFCWTINGGAWRKDVSREQANFELNLAKLRAKQRGALENLQRIAAAHEESERKRIEFEESVVSLESRGVYFSKSPVWEFNKFLTYLRGVSENDEIAKKWIQRAKNRELGNLEALYPSDHWLHNEQKFDQQLSAEFEDDGFCWTQKGGAWKRGLTSEQANAEMVLAGIISQERILIEKEEVRKEAEMETREKEKHMLDCIESLTSRGVYCSNSPVTNTSNLISYLKGTSSESGLSMKWTDYFNENSFVRIYPKDHWLHNEEDFDSKSSKKFEKDGFCWTENGGFWMHGLSMEQAKAEVKLAEVKAQQKAILEREQEKVNSLKKKGKKR